MEEIVNRISSAKKYTINNGKILYFESDELTF